MSHFGFTDSLAAHAGAPEECQTCRGTSRLQNGLCLGCLLTLGAAADEFTEDTEDLTSVLAELPADNAQWQLGNYVVLEEIGRGGMGVIYRARQRYSRRIVALKRILSYHADSPETVKRFRREAEAAASLDHPNILPIFEVGEAENKLPYFSMKFAPGGSLLEAAPAFRQQPRPCVALMVKIARALQYAHDHGVLHRDLKPGNILLDAHDTPMVSDFGLAKWLDDDSNVTRTLMIFGTPGYVAPEQARGGDAVVGPAADIYSLGAILFELLAGRPPFFGPHALSVINQAAETPAPKLRTICRSVDRDLETICSRCLEAEPAARYASAGLLADDLQRWLESRPIHARPISLGERAWRWGRRNPLLAGALAACMLIGALAAGRYEQAGRLQLQVREAQMAIHSIAVAPLLDLDRMAPDREGASLIAAQLTESLPRIGPARIVNVDQPDHWTGPGYDEEISALARQAQVRSVLTGTRRRVGEKIRFSLQLLAENGKPICGPRMVEITPDGIDGLFGDAELNSIYFSIGGTSRAVVTSPDPALTNERASAFMVAGRDLLTRRTIPELDRAIACFEGAVEAAPGSASARSFLAMALQGRELLGSDGKRTARALALAREAVELAPRDPTTRRIFCALYASNGRPVEAIEHGLAAIELGDRSGRALGQLGYALRVSGHPDRAIRCYLLARAKQQQPADYDALLGECWASIARDDEAERCYRSAATFLPDQPEGWIGLAWLKLVNADFDGARQLCRAQILHYPDSTAARQFAALVEFFARDFDAAGEQYGVLQRDDPLGGAQQPGYAALDYRSAQARVELARNDSDSAQRLLREVVAAAKEHLAVAPGDADTLYRLAAAESMVNDPSAALADFKQAIRAGWLDYRSPRIDPRFDNVINNAEFQAALSQLAADVAKLGQPFRADAQ